MLYRLFKFQQKWRSNLNPILPPPIFFRQPSPKSAYFATISLNHTKKQHLFAIIHGLLPQNASICASLMLNYAIHGRISTSQVLFLQRIQIHCSVFLCNTLIRAHTMAGEDGWFTIYNWMVKNCIRFDDHTFPLSLNSCTHHMQERKGMEIHGHAVKLSFDFDLYVGNTLIEFYGSCGYTDLAWKVFDEMPERDIISWNSIFGVLSAYSCVSRAFSLIREMMALKSTMKPNAVTIISILPLFAHPGEDGNTSGVHCYALKSGIDHHVTLRNALVHAYGVCENMVASKQVFCQTDYRNVASWNSIITHYSRCDLHFDSFEMFMSMIESNVKPDSITVSTVLSIVVELEIFNIGEEMHSYVLRTCMDPDIFTENSLIDLYGKSGKLSRAYTIFYNMSVKNVVSWNSIVAACAQNKHELEALNLVRDMNIYGVKPNPVTFVNALPACSKLGLLRHGKEIHALSLRMGYTCNIFVSNALIDMYIKCDHLNLSQTVFHMSFKDQVTYNTLIVGYSQRTSCHQSISLFSEMGRIGLKYNTVSFVGVLSACANQSAVKHGKEIHGCLVRNNLHSSTFIANSLLDFYTKTYKMDSAHKIFDGIMDKDAASWNTMILGYGMVGDIDTAIGLFEDMKKNGISCDSVSYVTILCICSHGGLVENGRKYFDEMKCRNINPSNVHYACMMDILGRAGLLEEACGLIQDMEDDADANVWGSLLGACCIHGNIELGRWAAGHLFRLKPYHCGYYILLSNLFADAGKWIEANQVRDLMKFRNLRKNPGCSWVEVNDRVHAFIAGEKVDGLDPTPWLIE